MTTTEQKNDLVSIPVAFLHNKDKVLKLKSDSTIKDIRAAVASAYSWPNSDFIISDLAGFHPDTFPITKLLHTKDLPLTIDANLEVIVEFNDQFFLPNSSSPLPPPQLIVSASTLTPFRKLKQIVQMKYSVPAKEILIRACGQEIRNDDLLLEWLFRHENRTESKKSPVVKVKVGLCEHQLSVLLLGTNPANADTAPISMKINCLVTYKTKLCDVRHQIELHPFLHEIGLKSTKDEYVFQLHGKDLADDCVMNADWYKNDSWHDNLIFCKKPAVIN